MDNKNKLILRYPASWWQNMWREALPSGNGEIGVAVHGGAHDEIILINHSKLRHLSNKTQLPDVSESLKETRKLMDKKMYKEANSVLATKLKETGYNTSLANILPLCDLKISMNSENAFKNYKRILDMETGEVIINWEEGLNNFKRKIFVSRKDDIIVYQINSNTNNLDCSVCLSMHNEDGYSSNSKGIDYVKKSRIKIENNKIYYFADHEDGTKYGAVLSVYLENGDINKEKDVLKINNTNKIFIAIKVFVNSNCDKTFKEIEKYFEKLNHSYDYLLNRHVNIHKKIFKSCNLNINDEKQSEYDKSNEELLLDAYSGEAPTSLLNKLWAYGRYLFISASKEEAEPCNMYGLWGGDYKLMWGHNMANENLQMIYWHTMVGGLQDMNKAIFKYYNNLIDNFKENAMKLFNCRGIYIPAGSTPNIGNPNQIVPVIMNWTSAAGWIARHYYEYYLYTGDLKFLKETALPFLREVALFYQDFIKYDCEGKIKYYPSVSPENTPKNYLGENNMPHPMPTTINATMDIAILKEVLTNLISGCNITNMYLDEVYNFEKILKSIPKYKINSDGAIREWMHDDFEDNYNHRHLSHLYPLFPGQEITREIDKDIYNACNIAVNKRKLGAQTGWSMAHMASIYARLQNGDKSLECLDILSRTCLLNNFYTVHNDWRNMGISMKIKTAPIQIDANMGIVNAIQEMLFYSSPKIIKFLPALPNKWVSGEIDNFNFCTGKVSFCWNTNKKDFKAVIVANRVTEMDIILPKYINDYNYKLKGNVKIDKIKENCIRVLMLEKSRFEVYSI